VPRVKHYFEKGHFYHVTTRTVGGVFAFDSDAAKQVIVDAMAFYRQRGDWRLHGFVIMANHVHVVVSQAEISLSGVIGNFKKWISNHLGGQSEEPLLERRFDDNAITHVKELWQVVDYVHNNPVRIGLVRRATDYFWSSARNYAGLKPVALEIDRLEGPL
jgi:putative transposase